MQIFLLCKTKHSTDVRSSEWQNHFHEIFFRLLVYTVDECVFVCGGALLYHLYMQFPLQSIDFHFIFLPAFFIYSIWFSVYNLAQQSKKKTHNHCYFNSHSEIKIFLQRVKRVRIIVVMTVITFITIFEIHSSVYYGHLLLPFSSTSNHRNCIALCTATFWNMHWKSVILPTLSTTRSNIKPDSSNRNT